MSTETMAVETEAAASDVSEAEVTETQAEPEVKLTLKGEIFDTAASIMRLVDSGAELSEEDSETLEHMTSFLVRTNSGLSAASIEAQLKVRAAQLAEKEKREEKVKERRKANAAKAAFIEKVTKASTLAEAQALASEAANFGGAVTVLPDGSFGTTVSVTKKGGGSGRPKADEPSGYVVVETGEPILGGFNTWVKAQLKDKAFSDAVVDAVHRPNGKLRPKAGTTKALVEAGIVRLA